MKSTFYFDHDYNARNDQRILELRSEFGWEGYGVYFGIIESLCESKGVLKREALGGLSLGLSIPKERLLILLDFMIKIGLLVEENGEIFSKRVNEHLSFRALLSEAGRRGGRGNKKGGLRDAKAPPEAVKESKGDESKGDDNKNKKETDLSFCDSRFIDAFKLWLEYKKEIRKPYKSQKTIEACYRNLLEISNLNPTTAKEIVNKSIMRGWDGLFPLQQNQQIEDKRLTTYNTPCPR